MQSSTDFSAEHCSRSPLNLEQKWYVFDRQILFDTLVIHQIVEELTVLKHDWEENIPNKLDEFIQKRRYCRANLVWLADLTTFEFSEKSIGITMKFAPGGWSSFLLESNISFANRSFCYRILSVKLQVGAVFWELVIISRFSAAGKNKITFQIQRASQLFFQKRNRFSIASPMTRIRISFNSTL